MNSSSDELYFDPCLRPEALVKTPGFEELPLPHFIDAIEGYNVRELLALTYALCRKYEAAEKELLELI